MVVKLRLSELCLCGDEKHRLHQLFRSGKVRTLGDVLVFFKYNGGERL